MSFYPVFLYPLPTPQTPDCCPRHWGCHRRKAVAFATVPKLPCSPPRTPLLLCCVATAIRKLLRSPPCSSPRTPPLLHRVATYVGKLLNNFHVHLMKDRSVFLFLYVQSFLCNQVKNSSIGYILMCPFFLLMCGSSSVHFLFNNRTFLYNICIFEAHFYSICTTLISYTVKEQSYSINQLLW